MQGQYIRQGPPRGVTSISHKKSSGEGTIMREIDEEFQTAQPQLRHTHGQSVVCMGGRGRGGR